MMYVDMSFEKMHFPSALIHMLRGGALRLSGVYLVCLLVMLVGCGQSTPTKGVVTMPIAQQALGSMSDSQSLRYQKALGYMRLGNYEQAEKGLKSLSRKVKGVQELLLNLSVAYFKQGKLTQASATLNDVLRINTDSEKAHNIAGLIAMRQGKFGQAETAFQKALTLKSDYALANYNIALLYDVYLQNVPRAVSHYEKYMAVVKTDETTSAWIEHLKNAVQ